MWESTVNGVGEGFLEKELVDGNVFIFSKG